MRRFYLENLCESQKNCTLQFCEKDPQGGNISLQFSSLACYVIAQQRPCLVRPSPTNTGEQRGRGGLTNITISSQVACDHRKVFRAELVSTPPDGLDTLTRSSKVRKR